ncbi:hypothetical protein [Lysinibacillus fusiformis]
MKKYEEIVTKSVVTMDALTLVCEILLIYLRKILCEKLSRLKSAISTFSGKVSDVLIMLK